jgi:hypothetical protein
MDLRKKSGFREKLLEEKMERLALSQDTRFDNISSSLITISIALLINSIMPSRIVEKKRILSV